ncbi:hypothetical protein ACNJX9_22185 [Bradyrhizobium sp. DASA03076]|jgi:hypothetical protein|uniref:Serine acetyltransferase n=1 Tax=Bradyrhizobium manausense TaxID=989370 RepID=A0A0R3D055_9BRAD|nr:hypothetical protein [Bradyrhizobium manausense]KRQ03114.1 serine acetyltransferase [Bradyrhizobium manausense]
MAIPLTRREAEAQAPASMRKADLQGFAFLATIAIVMTAWIGALVWAAMAFLSWLVS